MTETSPVIAVNDMRNQGFKVGTVGKVIDNVEVKIAEENGFMACSLGNSILRSETAGLYGISLFAAKSQL